MDDVEDWDDPRVQRVYGLLIDCEPPNPEEHWEGWAARRIVAELFPRLQKMADFPDEIWAHHYHSAHHGYPLEGWWHSDEGAAGGIRYVRANAQLREAD